MLTQYLESDSIIAQHIVVGDEYNTYSKHKINKVQQHKQDVPSYCDVACGRIYCAISSAHFYLCAYFAFWQKEKIINILQKKKIEKGG